MYCTEATSTSGLVRHCDASKERKFLRPKKNGEYFQRFVKPVLLRKHSHVDLARGIRNRRRNSVGCEYHSGVDLKMPEIRQLKIRSSFFVDLRDRFCKDFVVVDFVLANLF